MAMNDRTIPRCRRAGLLGALLAVALLAVALLAGCMPAPPQEELDGPIGPGEGGTPVSESTVETLPLLTPAGTTLGEFDLDTGYWETTFTGGEEDPLYYGFENGDDGLVMALLRISGRPDTPCRFDAAILARDEGFTILAAGDVTNDQGLEFHQVNLENGDVAQRFFCVELLNHLGVQFSITGVVAETVSYEQVHYVLNAVRE